MVSQFTLIKLLKKVWLINCFILIFLIIIRKGDDDNLSFSPFLFLESSKKSEKFLDNFIWSNIFVFFILGMIVSIKYS